MNEKIKIKIASVPHREEVVAELWVEHEAFAELSHDGGNLLIEFYPRCDGQPWSFSYEEISQALQKVKEKLVGK